MPVDPSVLTALAEVVRADPDNFAVRHHLAGLLLDDGQAEAADEHCRVLLAERPDDVDALALAARAAAALGDATRAERYDRIRAALAWEKRSTQPSLGLKRPAVA